MNSTHQQSTSDTDFRAKAEDALRITEIFYSLQGESRNVGLPTVFIRLTGCPLRCDYCDTAYAFTGGEWMEIESIIDEVKKYNTSHITVTGGEPLSQKNCIGLLEQLCNLGYEVTLETSGAVAVDEVDKRVVKVLDIKTPASGEESKNRFENLSFLTADDQIKFVICDENDYLWAKNKIEEYHISDHEIIFSPVLSLLEPEKLAEWIVKDRLNVRLQIQMHKYIWDPDKRGV